MSNVIPAVIVVGVVLFAITRMSPDSKIGKVVAPIVGGAAVFWEQIWSAVSGLM